MNWKSMDECRTLPELAAWAAANNPASVFPGDWMPLMQRAAQLGANAIADQHNLSIIDRVAKAN